MSFLKIGLQSTGQLRTGDGRLYLSGALIDCQPLCPAPDDLEDGMEDDDMVGVEMKDDRELEESRTMTCVDNDPITGPASARFERRVHAANSSVCTEGADIGEDSASPYASASLIQHMLFDTPSTPALPQHSHNHIHRQPHDLYPPAKQCDGSGGLGGFPRSSVSQTTTEICGLSNGVNCPPDSGSGICTVPPSTSGAGTGLHPSGRHGSPRLVIPPPPEYPQPPLPAPASPQDSQNSSATGVGLVGGAAYYAQGATMPTFQTGFQHLGVSGAIFPPQVSSGLPFLTAISLRPDLAVFDQSSFRRRISGSMRKLACQVEKNTSDSLRTRGVGLT
ncbi:unnamed protein product [Protopolystoma xenopodis]|uniref:Uncharacterized protein n=1 Tax=Protopolystoma xenopodis TaxID=117903 RepID=A0A3S5AUS5_9PLAT|nr:unnamed protein product [Protopolystoma xenopodis]